MSDVDESDLRSLLEDLKVMHDRPSTAAAPDPRDGSVYVMSPDIVTALQVALVTGRPLLLSGPPGCGKSTLASYVARNLSLNYFEFVVTEDSTPDQLLWEIDTLHRLNDAQRSILTRDDSTASRLHYTVPGPLWWALNPISAQRRGLPEGDGTVNRVPIPQHMPGATLGDRGTVLLIDEIDKADSAFCNGLLVPLGSRQFVIPDSEEPVRAHESLPSHSPLVIITTNNERDLPEAFIRRCLSIEIGYPDETQLMDAAKRHHPNLESDSPVWEHIRTLATQFGEYEQSTSTAEFLDLVAALLALDDLRPGSPDWDLVQRLVIIKPNVRRG